MPRLRSICLETALATGITFLLTGIASAGIHTWDVNEVFSNSDGTIQFVELWESAGGADETGVGNGTITSAANSFAFGQGAVTGSTANKFYLLATQGFADLPGAPTPDAIIPVGSVPFFNQAGGTVAFLSFDSWAFGSVPTNGTDSLDRITGVGANSPTNYAGQTASVNAASSPPSGLPISYPAVSVIAAGILAAGLVMARRKRNGA